VLQLPQVPDYADAAKKPGLREFIDLESLVLQFGPAKKIRMQGFWRTRAVRSGGF